MWLDGHWVRATPCLNLSRCQRFGVKALDFDGRVDAMRHPFDIRGRLHMEYVRQRGIYDDVPVAEVIPAMRATYPRVCGTDEGRLAGDFEAEAAALPPAPL